MDRNGQVALVTGANKGIGLETARQLAQLGMTVLLGARDIEKAEKAAEGLRSEGLDVQPIKLDVTSAADREAAVRLISERFHKLDVLVNNAGIMIEGEWMQNNTASVSLDTLQKTFDTNFFAPVMLTQALLPLLRKAPAARIVNLSSVQGSLAEHSDPKSPNYNVKPFGYDASKTALNAFTVHLAHELRGTGIKVNSAHPGWVKTEMGSDAAPMNVADGAKTTVELATLPDNGPSGTYVHMGRPLPW